MEDLESWLRNIIKQRDEDEISWFLRRPSLMLAKSIEKSRDEN